MERSNLPGAQAMTISGNLRRIAAGICIPVLTAASLAHSAEEDARIFALDALDLRTGGVAGSESAAQVLSELPGTAAAGDALSALWRPFFANAIVELGRSPSPAPAALYYNPLLDVALLTLWEKRDGRYVVNIGRAMPGERLNDPSAAVPLPPSWVSVAAAPLEALARTVSERLGAFRRAHPPNAAEGGRDAASFAAAAADMRTALARLVWNAALVAEWTEAPEPWLATALANVEEALAARDAAELTTAAPDTDADTAAALARLPIEFSEGLALDMVIQTRGNGRLLVGSLPEDGDIYVFALCMVSGRVCNLRRFVLTSLLE